MFLEIVSDAGDIGDHLLAIGQPDQDALSVGRVGLLRLLDQGLKDYALEEKKHMFK